MNNTLVAIVGVLFGLPLLLWTIYIAAKLAGYGFHRGWTISKRHETHKPRGVENHE